VLSAVKDGPGDLARVLALEEERLGLAVLETEDLAVTTDVELALLHVTQSASRSCPGSRCVYSSAASSSSSWSSSSVSGREGGAGSHLARVDLLAGETVLVDSHFVGCVVGWLLVVSSINAAAMLQSCSIENGGSVCGLAEDFPPLSLALCLPLPPALLLSPTSHLRLSLAVYSANIPLKDGRLIDHVVTRLQSGR